MRVHEGEPLLVDGALRTGVTLNPVNTVGVMGAGVAKIFKYFYPNMNKIYERLCKGTHIHPNGIMVYRPHRSEHYIANIPTKFFWGDPSPPEIITDSLVTFIRGARILKLFEPNYPINTTLLGSGKGGIPKEDARKLLMSVEKEEGVEFKLYNGSMSSEGLQPIEQFDGDYIVYNRLGGIVTGSANFFPLGSNSEAGR